MSQWGDPFGQFGSAQKTFGDFLRAFTEMPAVKEALASQAHQSWADWTAYMFSKCIRNPDGSVTIPAPFVARWTRQMGTQYAQLPENEKESDREEADKYLKVLNGDR
jgi:hypothetical protein